ncbi:MAG: SPFH domain-containing protein [Candidatus Njordarchaeota archaeon]
MFIEPGLLAWFVFLGFMIFIIIFSYWRSRYRIFETNVYVIHFRRGRVKRAGLGGSYWLMPIFDRLVTIPTTAQKVDITAERVISKENQEVVISGFVVWSVLDPAKVFSNVRWEQINTLIRDICESVIRTTAANMPLIDILREREKIIKAVAVELEKIVGDWGVKVLTVEIKEVDVVNKELFRNLQAEMFWTEWKKAQELRIQSEMRAGVLEQEKELQVGLREKEKTRQLREKEIEIAKLEAEREKTRRIINAEAESKSKILKAQGEAESEYLRLAKRAEGLRDLAEAIDERIIRYELVNKLPEVVQAFKGAFERAVFVGSSGGLSDLLGGIVGTIVSLTEVLGKEKLEEMKKKLLGATEKKSKTK